MYAKPRKNMHENAIMYKGAGVSRNRRRRKKRHVGVGMSAIKPTRKFVPLPGQEYTKPVLPIHKPSVNLSGAQNLTLASEAISEPKVLISGGGIGGLTLAILLLKANIPLLVLERAKEIKPLGEYNTETRITFKAMTPIVTSKWQHSHVIGAAIGLGATVAPLFIQLGIYDNSLRRAKLVTESTHAKGGSHARAYHEQQLVQRCVSFFYHTLKFFIFNVNPLTEALCHVAVSNMVSTFFPGLIFTTYCSKAFPRTASSFASESSLQQNEDGVMVSDSDNSSYYGDLLVGADGAYSTVRQHLKMQCRWHTLWQAGLCGWE